MAPEVIITAGEPRPCASFYGFTMDGREVRQATLAECVESLAAISGRPSDGVVLARHHDWLPSGPTTWWFVYETLEHLSRDLADTSHLNCFARIDQSHVPIALAQEN